MTTFHPDALAMMPPTATPDAMPSTPELAPFTDTQGSPPSIAANPATAPAFPADHLSDPWSLMDMETFPCLLSESERGNLMVDVRVQTKTRRAMRELAAMSKPRDVKIEEAAKRVQAIEAEWVAFAQSKKFTTLQAKNAELQELGGDDAPVSQEVVMLRADIAALEAEIVKQSQALNARISDAAQALNDLRVEALAGQIEFMVRRLYLVRDGQEITLPSNAETLAENMEVATLRQTLDLLLEAAERPFFTKRQPPPSGDIMNS